jgi:UDP-N-acetylglucosamine--N-acetylmuramyl-(pentapeptide) pyrophosphoryl-undecaprenol N-acetylglucosamine transferase
MQNNHLDTIPSNTQGGARRAEDQRLRVVISGGGTGGHIYPALAVARELRQRYQAQILYIGDSDGLEKRLVPEAGFQLETIHAGRLLRYWSMQTIRNLARVPIGFVEARRIMREFSPHATFTSGGYVAVPVGYAARRLGVPLLIHQQDVSPNLANRLLRRMATRISTSFEDSAKYFPRAKTQVMGNPVRDVVIAQAGSDLRVHKRELNFSPAFPLLVVTGGSQGARHINEALVATLPALLERFQILHISGQYTFDETRTASVQQVRDLPEHVAARYHLVPYLNDEMAVALAAADAVIARAGAATLAELAVLGKPSILVPLPPGFGGSPQEANAAMFAQHGAAQVVLDKDLNGETLRAAVQDLFASPETRMRMGLAARGLARPRAAADLANTVVALGQMYIEERRKRMVEEAIRKASK